MTRMAEPPRLLLYGAPHSGAVAVEAVLTLLGEPYDLVEGETWSDPAARERVAVLNPMRQVPTLVFPSGEVMTESAAILLRLAETHPAAGLAPAIDDPRRAAFLRWMAFVSSSIYALCWVKADVRRVGVPASRREAVVDAVHERIAACWAHMDATLAPGPHGYLLGASLTVLDLYVAVVSRFGPWRPRFVEVAPRLAAVVARVDADPRLRALWARRFPTDEGA